MVKKYLEISFFVMNQIAVTLISILFCVSHSLLPTLLLMVWHIRSQSEQSHLNSDLQKKVEMN